MFIASIYRRPNLWPKKVLFGNSYQVTYAGLAGVVLADDDRCGVDDVFLPDLCCDDIEPPKKKQQQGVLFMMRALA